MTGRKTTGEPRAGAADALDSLGRVFSELVHDLASDLVVLQGWAQLARGEAEDGRPPVEELDRVVDLSESVGTMLRDLLSIVEGRTLSPEVDFSPAVVTKACLGYRVRELSSLTVSFRSELPAEARVRGFASFWTRIVANLLSNAARHARSNVLVTLEAADGEVLLRVEDDGPGVDPSLRERIFDPLWSGGASGAGLGLSSVAWLVQKLSGSAASVDPRELTGASFEVRAPLVRSRRAAMPPDSARETIRGNRILLVDDDPSVRHALSRLLARVGAEIRELDPSDQTDEQVLESAIAAVPDVVLLDLRLGRRGGTALWRHLEARVPALARRTVFVTGAAPGDPDWEQAATTAQPILAKPFTLQQLAEAIDRLG